MYTTGKIKFCSKIYMPFIKFFLGKYLQRAKGWMKIVARKLNSDGCTSNIKLIFNSVRETLDETLIPAMGLTRCYKDTFFTHYINKHNEYNIMLDTYRNVTHFFHNKSHIILYITNSQESQHNNKIATCKY